MERRTFLKAGAAAGGGLLVGFSMSGCDRGQPSADGNGGLDAWIRVGTDNRITLRVASAEMGQGVATAIPMLLAEELEADWTQVQMEFAPVAREYINPLSGEQSTGGSTAVRGYWQPLREAGAAARELLIMAAAQKWGVAAGECRARNSMVRHEASGRQVRYADVVSLAATLKPPKEVALKPASEFRLIGQPVKRLDTPAKTDGSAQFGCDVRVPGMLYATVLRSPTIGGRLRSHDATAARAVKGVRDVIAIDSGIAVVADNTWAALRGRQALQAEWDSGKTAQLDSAAIRERLRKATTRRGKVLRDEGDAEKALKGATRRIDALYETPYLAHACMEPMNCTAWVRADKAEVWVPTQSPAAARRTAARISGLNESAVQIHTTFLGGGFGRRLSQDFVAEAVAVAKVVRAPVQVMWTREDDMRNDFYRPANCTTLSAVLDAGGAPLAWFQRVAGPSRALWGIDLPYAIPDILIEQVEEDPGVPTGAWRSVGASQNAYVSECFIDELARAAGKDPYLYRRALLTNQPRYRDVLDLAAGMYGWERKLPAGRHRGIALVRSFGSYVAQVAEVSVGNGEVRVHRVVCAVDCGMYVNPNIIAAQMESGIIFGLTAALKGEITLDHGRIVQGNFNDYPLLTMAESPEIEVHIVQSSEAPGGVGEPGTPPIAPAVANAVYAATGRPVRRLPIRL